MQYAAGTHIKVNLYNQNNKLRRTDGIFPTETMRLHQRIIAWHRKRRIPVRDADQPSNLNAYLIDPKYLENGEISMPRELPPVDSSSRIPVYQYSKMSRASTPSRSETLNAIKHAGNFVKAGTIAWTDELAIRIHRLTRPKTTTRYNAASGVLPWWRQKIRLFVLPLLFGVFIVLAATLESNQPIKPLPVNANSQTTSTHSTDDQSSAPSISMDPSGDSNSTNGALTHSKTPMTQSMHTISQQTTPITYQTMVNSPVYPAPSTTAQSPPASTSLTPVPMAPVPADQTSGILDPILTPVTGLVKDVLSTQITVNTSL